jgi:3',5'-cyclic AMP phosphodiesterase CpdA
MMKRRVSLPLLFIFSISLFIHGCREYIELPLEGSTIPKSAGTLKMAVFADPHYYDPSLGISGAAFLNYIAHDRKMIAESEAILEATVQAILAEDADVVLVPGDLTKDGVELSHRGVAVYLQMLEDAGKRVFVVPGNHDVSNPHSYSYPEVGDPVLEDNVSPDEFEQIFYNYGFDEAVHRDPHSLSYVAELQKGVWLMALDGCNYNNKFPHLSLTAGSFSQETMSWIVDRLQEANASDITVFGMMHHGIVEHFPGMDQVFPEYLIDNWTEVSSVFAENGMNVVFTGHHHATDISRKRTGENFIIDIQTGSTVTWKCPYRVVRYTKIADLLEVENNVITEIAYNLGGMSFQAYAYDFLAQGLPALVVYQLMGMGLDEPTAKAVEPLVTATLIAYYHGDERELRDQEVMLGIAQLLQSGDPMAVMLGELLTGIWTDNTADNNVFIELRRGAILTTPGS